MLILVALRSLINGELNSQGHGSLNQFVPKTLSYPFIDLCWTVFNSVYKTNKDGVCFYTFYEHSLH